MRTMSRDEYRAMTEAWSDFGVAWKPWRELALARNIVYPPSGLATDSIEDPEPSQRAIIWQAIEDTPVLLSAAILASKSWREVVGRLLLGRERLREDASLRERDAAWYRQDEPTRREAAETIGSLLRKIGDSVGVERGAA